MPSNSERAKEEMKTKRKTFQGTIEKIASNFDWEFSLRFSQFIRQKTSRDDSKMFENFNVD